jgi:FkbM family methyltransferase
MAHRGLAPRALWQRLPVEQPVVVEFANREGFRWTGPDVVARRLYWVGDVEESETLPIWCRLARTAETIVDVGANLGFFTLTACSANPNATVVAFEPVQTLAKQLEHNIADNGWRERCTVNAIALGDRSGEAALHIPGAFSTMASLDPAGFRGRPGVVVNVPIDTLDRAIAPGRRVDLVKVDVEKFEDAVLRGMSRILKIDRPAIVFECLPDGPFRAVERILVDAGYQIFHLTVEGPRAVRKIVPDSAERLRNFLALGLHTRWMSLMASGR